MSESDIERLERELVEARQRIDAAAKRRWRKGAARCSAQVGDSLVTGRERRSCSPRSARSAASKQTHNSHATAASHHSKEAQAKTSDTDSTAAATANSTPRSTESQSRKRATTL